MGCCWESADNAPSNRNQAQVHGIVTTQPIAQPNLEKPGSIQPFHYQPTVASPPPAVVNPATMNGFDSSAIPPWGQSPSPPIQNSYEFGAGSPSPPIPSSSPGIFTTTNYPSNGAADALMSPQAVYQQIPIRQSISSPPPIDLSHISVPDEGKISVAVDFGERPTPRNVAHCS